MSFNPQQPRDTIGRFSTIPNRQPKPATTREPLFDGEPAFARRNTWAANDPYVEFTLNSGSHKPCDVTIDANTLCDYAEELNNTPSLPDTYESDTFSYQPSDDWENMYEARIGNPPVTVTLDRNALASIAQDATIYAEDSGELDCKPWASRMGGADYTGQHPAVDWTGSAPLMPVSPTLADYAQGAGYITNEGQIARFGRLQIAVGADGRMMMADENLDHDTTNANEHVLSIQPDPMGRDAGTGWTGRADLGQDLERMDAQRDEPLTAQQRDRLAQTLDKFVDYDTNCWKHTNIPARLRTIDEQDLAGKISDILDEN